MSVLSKSGKAEQCREALNGFNLGGDDQQANNFGSGTNGYIRTICAGNTFLLTNPEKAYVIQEKGMCDDNNKLGFDTLDEYVAMAERAGGCTGRPHSGQPSRAMAEYIKCRDDAKVATEMVCTDAKNDDGSPGDQLCWSVMYQLTKEDCWKSEDLAEPDLDNDDCLPTADKFETHPIKGEDKEVQVNVSCDCLRAYVGAYSEFTKDGLNSFGADKNTLALVAHRISTDCSRA